MTEIELFNYRGRDVRTLLIDGEPWFVLADLCKVLGIASASAVTDVKKRLDQCTLDSTKVANSAGFQRDTDIVSEPGMYEVVIRSDKPEAVMFRRWITRTVLPSIRKTGGYSIKPEKPALPENYLAALKELVVTVEAKQGLERKIEEDRPKVKRAEMHAASKGLKSRREFAREVITGAEEIHNIALSEREVFLYLSRPLKMFTVGPVKTGGGLATRHSLDRGWCAENHSVIEDAKNGGTFNTTNGKLTPKGEEYAWGRIMARLENFGYLT